MTKILVIGNGFLGGVISRISKIKDFDTYLASQNCSILMDVRKIEMIDDAVKKIDPDVIINCAAITELDKIEKESKDAYAVNAYGAENIAKIASRYSKRLIHISTDSVFDGKKGNYLETDYPNPVNEYAKSKKNGEELIKKTLENYVIVRTNFYGNNIDGKFFFNWILKNLNEQKKINGFVDVTFNPLEIENLSMILLELTESKYRGLLHVASDKTYSKYEFARTIAEKLGYDSNLIIKGKIGDKLVARRPCNTTLNNELAKKIIKNKFLDLETWLEKMKQDFDL